MNHFEITHLIIAVVAGLFSLAAFTGVIVAAVRLALADSKPSK